MRDLFSPPLTACFLIIGNEILSGRTQDVNLRTLAHGLNQRGIPLKEVRILPDQKEIIVKTIIECRAAFDLVFTSGGIGPTHDDITIECVAEAFNLPLVKHEETFKALEECLPKGAFNEAQQRMAYFPQTATPIYNHISKAPGFSIGNLHVMAGVPEIFKAMVTWLMPNLPASSPLISKAWYSFDLLEGTLAAPLKELQENFSHCDIGSYPFQKNDRHGVTLIAKGYHPSEVEQAGEALAHLIKNLGFSPIEGEA